MTAKVWVSPVRKTAPTTVLQYTKRIKDMTEGERDMFKMIVGNPGFNPKQISEALGWSRLTVQSLVTNLVCAGLIVEKGDLESPSLWAVELPKSPSELEPSQELELEE